MSPYPHTALWAHNFRVWRERAVDGEDVEAKSKGAFVLSIGEDLFHKPQARRRG